MRRTLVLALKPSPHSIPRPSTIQPQRLINASSPLGNFLQILRDERPTHDQPRQSNSFVVSRALVPILFSRGSWRGKKGSISGEQRSNETWPIWPLLLTVISCCESWWWWWLREKGGDSGKGMDRSAGRGWILPAFNSSRSVYLLISSGLERRIATPCQMFFSSSRVFLLGERDVFQQLWRRIINGLFSCWGRDVFGRIDRDGFGVVRRWFLEMWVME